MASKVVGSKVVLCTDGYANAGVGNLSSSSSPASEFYTNLGETASSKGFVSVFMHSSVVVAMICMLSVGCILTVADQKFPRKPALALYQEIITFGRGTAA